MWVNRFLYVSSDGTETSPRIQYKFESGRWLQLKTIVDRTNVKIFINGTLIKEVTMTGEGADSESENYVGLWCHRLVFIAGKEFKVSSCKCCFTIFVYDYQSVHFISLFTSGSPDIHLFLRFQLIFDYCHYV